MARRGVPSHVCRYAAPRASAVRTQVCLSQVRYGSWVARTADPHGVVADELLDAVGVLVREVRRHLRQRLPFKGLTGAQVDLIGFVHDYPQVRVGEVAAAMRLAPNTVSTMVQQLVAAGYLRRQTDRTDRRVGRLSLTRRAADEWRRWRSLRRELVGAELQGLDADAVQALRAALPALHELADRLRADFPLDAAG